MSENTSSEERWTVLRLLTWTSDYLKKYAAPSPRLDAEVLLSHVLGCRRVDLYTRFDHEPTEAEKRTFRQAIQKRAQGMPVAYLVGKKEFYSLDFYVDQRVLIPRPETEFVLVGLFDEIKKRLEGTLGSYTLCDVGTGSGILAITAAVHLKNARVLALDVSPDALEVARKNAEFHADKVGDRITFRQSDLFSVMPQDRVVAFDFILSNPPYVGRSEIDAALEKDVYRYEPHGALFGGETGTELITRFLPEVPRYLKSGGLFFMELSPMIHDAVVEIAAGVPELEYAGTIRDLERRERVLVLKKTKNAV
ncbi:MAG: peptide chain release factor N(5)-glutamine methyltransferase [Planctomycetia bacterium]|nr:peptide chain release factor N(5)-glutamine methyltransferase [Planctomycetia bacterium]